MRLESPETAALVSTSSIFGAIVLPRSGSLAPEEGLQSDFPRKGCPQRMLVERRRKAGDCIRKLSIGSIARASAEPRSILVKTREASPSLELEG